MPIQSGTIVTNPRVKTRKAEDLRRIADTLTDPKDAELVRAYAAEIAAAGKADR
jgi:hypothetical protein